MLQNALDILHVYLLLVSDNILLEVAAVPGNTNRPETVYTYGILGSGLEFEGETLEVRAIFHHVTDEDAMPGL